MDSDISHAVEERLAALEERVAALEDGGKPPKPEETTEDTELYVTEESA